ncbi:uncharacterized protein LOC141853294 [Brevipalpus obovatus]|uniref:uncharacterized protein LOC141853294 n=1 Tax=Brevipalpus obovatus TaxID=246614 RepID=UPI003D9E4BC6
MSKDQQSVISDSSSKNNSKQSTMTTELTRCSEERNVLDELLGAPEDDDFASEFNCSEKKSGNKDLNEPLDNTEQSVVSKVKTTRECSPSSKKIEESSKSSFKPSSEKKEIRVEKVNKNDKETPLNDLSRNKNDKRTKDSRNSKLKASESDSNEDDKKDTPQERSNASNGSQKTNEQNSKSEQRELSKSKSRSPPLKESNSIDQKVEQASGNHESGNSSDDDTCSCMEHSSAQSVSSSCESRPSSVRSKSPPSRSKKPKRSKSPKDEIRHRTKSSKLESKKRRLKKQAGSRKTHGKRDYSSLLKYFFRDTVYFVMKSNNQENVVLSKTKGVWSTPPQNEHKLNRAFKEFRNVILVFSVKESGRFQGFARLASESRHNAQPIDWILPPGLSAKALGGVFDLDWICRKELPFSKTLHLFNPLNEGKPVKIARDGQEIEPRVGEELCRLFPADDSIDLMSHLKKMKKQNLNKPKPSHSRQSEYRLERVETRRPRPQYSPNSSYNKEPLHPNLKRKRSGHISPPPPRRPKREYRDWRNERPRERIPPPRRDFLGNDLTDYFRPGMYESSFSQYNRKVDAFIRRNTRPLVRERRRDFKPMDRRY